MTTDRQALASNLGQGLEVVRYRGKPFSRNLPQSPAIFERGSQLHKNRRCLNKEPFFHVHMTRPSMIVGIVFLLLFCSVVSAHSSFDVSAEDEKCEVQRQWLAGNPQIVELESFAQRNESERAKIANQTYLILIVSRADRAVQATYVEAINSLLRSAPNLKAVRIYGGVVLSGKGLRLLYDSFKAYRRCNHHLLDKGILVAGTDLTVWFLFPRVTQKRLMEKLVRIKKNIKYPDVTTTITAYSPRLAEIKFNATPEPIENVTFEDISFIIKMRLLTDAFETPVDSTVWNAMVSALDNQPLYRTPFWCDRQWMFDKEDKWALFARSLYPINGDPPLDAAKFEESLLRDV
ncbi:hypothetical protein M3Y99_01802000 [Aphelenchoides fujianensis]|nr:hypothetical protein M3Y99_01802000 [Aphelenchoides fujianensis]